jgi:hypothetical protein
MNTALKKLAIVLRDTTGFSESDIFIGRNGFRVDDFSGRQITVDSTSPASILSVSESYDGDAEVSTYSQQLSVPCTVNFYGSSAYEDATKFSLLLRSQAGYENQRDNGISIFDVGQLIDVKFLTGEQYNGRIQLNLNVAITISTTVDTLYIDTAQIAETKWEA